MLVEAKEDLTRQLKKYNAAKGDITLTFSLE